MIVLNEPLRILHLTTHLNIGGITTYIYLLGQQMIAEGHQIFALSSGGECSKQYHEAGIKTLELPIKTKSELHPKIYWSIPKVIELIQLEKIDLIHAHTRITQVMAWWIQRKTGIPYVSTCHGFYKRRFGRRLLPAWGNRVIAISQPVADSLINDFGEEKEKVATILNAIDITGLQKRVELKDVAAIRAEWGFNSKVPTLGIVARIVQDKGHEFLVKATKQLLNTYSDLKVLIVGEGPYKKQIVKMVDQLGLHQHVHFIGNLSDVTKALCVIDIFVLPAIWREGFGLSIIEAMALKKPVIVTNIWALNALVRDRDNGLLINPSDTDALVKAIKTLIDDHTLRNHVSNRGFETVSREFSIERMSTEMTQLYRQVLNESRPQFN